MVQISVLGKRRYLVDQLKSIFPNQLKIRHIKKPSEISEDDDLTFCLSYYRLIKPPHFNFPKYGTFVAHASDLPKGRGWAPVNWALINGEDQVTVTTFKVDGGCDTGPYHLKSTVDLEKFDSIETAYAKVEPVIVNHLKSIVFEVIQYGEITLHLQQGEPTIFPRRRANDSELNLDQSLRDQWNLLRACHNTDYPAFIKIHGKRVYLRYEITDE